MQRDRATVGQPDSGASSGRGRRRKRKDKAGAVAAGAADRLGTPASGRARRKGAPAPTEEEELRTAVEVDRLLAPDAGYLEAEGIEQTHRFKQEDIKQHVDEQSAGKAFDLRLTTFGPYVARYAQNGRHLLLCGRKGHIASMDWSKHTLQTEVHVNETARDCTYLHNSTMFAVAQKKYVHIYDDTGMELHCLRNHVEVNRLEFLPYHFLLVSVGNAGYLKYQDTSTGQLVVEHRTRLGKCNAMAQNPNNAIIHCGHSNGTVTLWSPNISTPVVRMFCHRGPLRSIAIDRAGRYMVTAGQDNQVKVFDVRTYKELHSYFSHTPASEVSISERGVLGVAYSVRAEFWKDALISKAQKPYMTHTVGGKCQTSSLRFCPYEDTCAIGHALGLASILVPGSGEPGYDTYAANPFETNKQRREREVHQLLDKIQPEMIMLDPDRVGTVDKASKAVRIDEQRAADARERARAGSASASGAADARSDAEEDAEEASEKAGGVKLKHKMRGRSRAGRRYKRKQANVIERERAAFRVREVLPGADDGRHDLSDAEDAGSDAGDAGAGAAAAGGSDDDEAAAEAKEILRTYRKRTALSRFKRRKH